MEFVIGIILCIVGLALCIWAFVERKNISTRNDLVDKENELLSKTNAELLLKQNKMVDEIQALLLNRQNYQNDVNNLISYIAQLNEKIEDITLGQQEISRKAFENYCQILDNEYAEKTKEYEKSLTLLEESYENTQLTYLADLQKQQKELDKIKATRAAALEAQIKEQEIKEKLSFYCLQLSSVDLSDIQVLETIKPKLAKPRVLSMLIWSTFFQKPMTQLCNNILGTSEICGIYKITNQKNNMCYIGQSVNVSDRWKQHAKCGLGIDTPAANKLYKAMIEEGIWNFSWELLETCPAEELNEKEKYYIELYQSCEFGYNSTKGNK